MRFIFSKRVVGYFSVNRVRGPYCKLRTEFFPVNQRKKRGSVIHSTDRENEVIMSKIFVISLWLIGGAGKETS